MKEIYYNGHIYQKKGMESEAMGVEEGMITFVGSRQEAEVWAAGGETHYHDLFGTFVVPGLIDSHMHLLAYGYGQGMVDLRKRTSSLNDLLQCLAEYNNSSMDREEEWIIGRGFHQDDFQDEKRFPTRYDLDRISRDRPILIIRSCGHIAIANSAALLIAHITKKTPQPAGGRIDVDENGEPTGILREYGIDCVSRFIPKPGKDKIKQYLLLGMKKLNAYGITSVQSDDFGAFSGVNYETVIQAYKELEAEGHLTVKVYEQCLLSEMESLKDFLFKGYRTGVGTSYFTIGPLKIIADGSLGARTAYLETPYADQPDHRGILIYSQKELEEKIAFGVEHGMQVAIHAIGDGAMNAVVNAFSKVQMDEKDNKRRHGIVHAQITTKELIKQFQRLNLHVYIQSVFLNQDNHIIEKRVGKQRAEDTYLYRTLFDLGIEVSNGSDAPVEEPSVLSGIQCAVTRTTLDGTKQFLPNQALTVEEALETYTAMGAKASFEEKKKGMLLPGMAADFTILSEDLRHCNPERIKDIKVLKTYVDGVCVYDAKDPSYHLDSKSR